MLTNSWLEIPEIKLIDFVIMQLMNELCKAKCYSSAGRVRHNPGERLVSVDQVLPMNTESSKQAVPAYCAKRES
jgi:hypothetical protein